MERSSGFTLIELLLVLAIIGIISAIAVPSLLSQRARARDKTATTNCVGHVGDMVGQWDKGKEAGLSPSSIQTAMRDYLVGTTGKEKSPWDPTVTAYSPQIFLATGALTQSAFEQAMNPSPYHGRTRFWLQQPTSSQSGYLGGIVWVANPVNSSNYIRKSVSIE